MDDEAVREADDWQLPDYTHLRELGAGAAGRVVLARHDPTGTPVAIKYLHDTAAGPALRTEGRWPGSTPPTSPGSTSTSRAGRTRPW